MKRPRKITLGCLLGVLGLATVLALVPFQVLVWDGGFPSIECRLRFVESNGNPVPGVKLTVHNKAGGVSHFYPVDEFVPESPVTSDDEGWMVFHHVSRGFEFGGKDYRSVLGFTLSEAKSPYYECVFSLVDREVFRTSFNFHHREWDEFQKPRVIREWKSRQNDLSKYGWFRDDDIRAWQLRVFDTNKDGTLDREERTAAGSFSRRLELEVELSSVHDLAGQLEHKPVAIEIDFRVVERTIVIANP